jgi:hypothetical protein
LVAAVLATLLLSGGACSSNKGSDDVSASDAANTVAVFFSVSDDQRACLEQHFGEQADARRVFSSQGVASDDDLRAFGEVEAACVPAETLAAALTAGADASFGGTLTDTQKTCLAEVVTALDDGDRTTLLVGLVLSESGALDGADIAEMGQVTGGLLQACQLDVATTQTLPPTAG